MLSGAEAFAEADQDEQRANSPDDSEHSEETTQLICGDGAKDLAEDVGETLHSALDSS